MRVPHIPQADWIFLAGMLKLSSQQTERYGAVINQTKKRRLHITFQTIDLSINKLNVAAK